MADAYINYDYQEMLQSFGLTENQSEAVLTHFGGEYEVDTILHKYGHGTATFLPTIVEYFKEVPVTFPDHVTVPDGKSYFLLLFSVLY